MYFNDLNEILESKATENFYHKKRAINDAKNETNKHINNEIKRISSDKEEWKSIIISTFKKNGINIKDISDKDIQDITDAFNNNNENALNKYLFELLNKTLKEKINSNIKIQDIHQSIQENIIKSFNKKKKGKAPTTAYERIKSSDIARSGNPESFLKNKEGNIINITYSGKDDFYKKYYWLFNGSTDYYIASLPTGSVTLRGSQILNGSDGILKKGKEVHITELKNGKTNESMKSYITKLAAATVYAMNGKRVLEKKFKLGKTYIIKDEGTEFKKNFDNLSLEELRKETIKAANKPKDITKTYKDDTDYSGYNENQIEDIKEFKERMQEELLKEKKDPNANNRKYYYSRRYKDLLTMYYDLKYSVEEKNRIRSYNNKNSKVSINLNSNTEEKTAAEFGRMISNIPIINLKSYQMKDFIKFMDSADSAMFDIHVQDPKIKYKSLMYNKNSSITTTSIKDRFIKANKYISKN